uniref:Uncharacterized protein n=1 Tax=Aegilops tauschii TaxID=37682 RepID=M8B8G2_AEGTA
MAVSLWRAMDKFWSIPDVGKARLSVMPVPVEVWDGVCEMGGGFVQDGEVGEEEAEG